MIRDSTMMRTRVATSKKVLSSVVMDTVVVLNSVELDICSSPSSPQLIVAPTEALTLVPA